jgi:hypothetical protein
VPQQSILIQYLRTLNLKILKKIQILYLYPYISCVKPINSLNFDKTHYIKLTIKNSHQFDLVISYVNKLISKELYIKFLGIYLDSTLSWKIHIEQIIPKLSAACYAVRSIQRLMSQETLMMVYYACVHSVMSYGLIFWGNSTHSITFFKIQKNMIRIIRGRRSRDSYRDLFKNLNVLPLQLQYILSLLLFLISRKINSN